MAYPSTALGIETGASELRVIQLAAGATAASVTGYAAVARPTDSAQLGKAIGQLIAALKPEADAAINIVDTASTDERALNDVLARLGEMGMRNVDFEPAAEARERAIGRNPVDAIDGFIDCPIPRGLLEAHERLEALQLAPAVGAALARLGLGFGAERDTDEHIAVWIPEPGEPDHAVVAGDPEASVFDIAAPAPVPDRSLEVFEPAAGRSTELGDETDLTRTAAVAPEIGANPVGPRAGEPLEIISDDRHAIPDEGIEIIDAPDSDPVDLDEHPTADPSDIGYEPPFTPATDRDDREPAPLPAANLEPRAPDHSDLTDRPATLPIADATESPTADHTDLSDRPPALPANLAESLTADHTDVSDRPVGAPQPSADEPVETDDDATRRRGLVPAILLLLAIIALLVGLALTDRGSESTTTASGAASTIDDATADTTTDDAASDPRDSAVPGVDDTDRGVDDTTDDSTSVAAATTSEDDSGAADVPADIGTEDETNSATDAGSEDETDSATDEGDGGTPAPAAPDNASAADGESTADDASEAGAGDLADLPPLSDLPERVAVFRASEGLLYLEGPITAEEAAIAEARAIEVLGPDRVVNNYIIRPDAPPVTEGNVRIEQAVLFETGSATITESFIPTLELGVLVMNLNPQVTMVVEGHTDDTGAEDTNQRLSEARAQAVVEYLVGRGIERARLSAIGYGELEPIAPNDTIEGRQLNRRIEVDLVDLLADRPAEASTDS